MTIKAIVIDDEESLVTPMLDELKGWFEKGQFSYKHVPTLDMGLIEIRAEIRDAAGVDVVFLDIKGIDEVDEDDDDDAQPPAIPLIREINPYLPVIMFSAQLTVNNILDYLDRGASTFILKRELLDVQGEGLDDPGQRRNLRGRLKFVQRIRKVVALYQPIKRLLASRLVNGTVRKSGPPDELNDQIGFLCEVASLEEVKDFFPHVTPDPGFAARKCATFYEMPFYEMKDLHRFLLAASDKEACIDVATIALAKVIREPFCFLALKQKREEICPDPHALFFDPFKDRRAKVLEKLEAVGDAAESSARDLGRLLRGGEILMDKRRLMVPSQIADLIQAKPELYERLCPPFLSLVHGDLHFRNILLDDRLPLMMPVKLIDPRGKGQAAGLARGVGDPACDIGKLLHSSEGRNFFILDHLYGPRGGRWDIEFTPDFETATVASVFFESTEGWASVGGGLSRSAVNWRRPRVQKWIWDVCDELTGYILDEADKALKQDDPHWRVRAELYEAMLLCQSAPLRLNDDPEAAISLYLRGVQLLNRFWDEYGPKPAPPPL